MSSLQVRIAKRRIARATVALALERIDEAFKYGGTGGASIDWGVAEHLLRVAADQIALAEKSR